MRNNFMTPPGVNPIQAIDQTIDNYVEQAVDILFQNYNMRNLVLRSNDELTNYSVSDLERIQHEEKDAARRVLKVIASIEKYHQETIGRNDNQLRIAQYGDIGKTTKLQLMSQTAHTKPSMDRIIRGIKHAFSKAVCTSKNFGVDVFAKSYARKCARKLSINTYLRDINDDEFLSKKVVRTMRKVLESGGSIRESFNENSPVFQALAGYEDPYGRGHIPGYIDEMRQSLINSEIVRETNKVRQPNGWVYPTRLLLDNPRRFFEFQSRYDYISDKILDFESMAMPLATAKANIDRSDIGNFIVQRLKGFISPYYESEESYIKNLQKMLFDITKEIRVDFGHNEYSFEDIRGMVERTYRAMRTRAVITENMGINKGDEHLKAAKLKRYDQSTKVSVHKSTFTSDRVEKANEVITKAAGAALLGTTIYYLFQVPDPSHWTTYGVIAAATGAAYASVAVKKIKEKFTVTKGSSYFKQLTEEEQYAINSMVADRLNAIETQAEMMQQRMPRKDRYNTMEL